MEILRVGKATDLANECRERAERLSNLAVAPSNAGSYEALRTENNKYIRECEKSLEEARKAFLEPFEAEAMAYTEALRPLKEANKAFSKAILDCRKESFRQEMEEEYGNMVTADTNGELVPFTEVYDPTWYSLTKAEARKALAKALRVAKMKREKGTIAFTAYASLDRLAELELYMETHGISYVKEE